MSEKDNGIAEAEKHIKFTVNGESHELRVQSNWSLREVLHDKLGLLGVKEFCDRGVCGSCAVIMEGRPILSCMQLAIECMRKGESGICYAIVGDNRYHSTLQAIQGCD